jgi:hypothetical protein
MSDSRASYTQDLLDDAAQPTMGSTQDLPDAAAQLITGAAHASSPSSASSAVLVETLDSDNQSENGYDSEPSANSQASWGDGVEIGPIPIPINTCRLYLVNGNICGGLAGKRGRPSHARLLLTRTIAPPEQYSGICSSRPYADGMPGTYTNPTMVDQQRTDHMASLASTATDSARAASARMHSPTASETLVSFNYTFLSSLAQRPTLKDTPTYSPIPEV